MFKEKVKMEDACSLSVARGAAHKEDTSISGYYTVECVDKYSRLKWKDEIHNLVTTVGKNLAMDTVFDNTSAGNVVMGLKGEGDPEITDTQSSHSNWLEVGLLNNPKYSGDRKSPTFSAAVDGVKSTSAVSKFEVTSTGVVTGCFINIGGSATIDDTTGTLFSVGDFTGGSKSVSSGDSLNVSYSVTAA